MMVTEEFEDLVLPEDIIITIRVFFKTVEDVVKCHHAQKKKFFLKNNCCRDRKQKQSERPCLQVGCPGAYIMGVGVRRHGKKGREKASRGNRRSAF